MRGAGTASATVRAALKPENGSDSATLVTLHTTLNVTGRPAQFGRGVIAEVGSRLIDKFADNLAQQLAGGGPAASPAAPAAGTATGTAAAESAPGETAATPAAEAAAAPVGETATAPAGEAAAAPVGEAAAAASTSTATAAAPHSVPMRPASPPPPPAPAPAQEDSLNLLSIAGPVIAKRVAPVAGALTGVALIFWLSRRVRRRRAS
jgi:hypothetical protein